MQIVFKNKTRLGNNFHFKDRIPKDFTFKVVYKFQCGLWNESYYGGCVRHLTVRIGEHIGIPPFTKKQVKPKKSSVVDHLLFYKHSASYDNFSTLIRETKIFLLELKENLLIMRDIETLHRHHCNYSRSPSNRVFIRLYLFLIVAKLFLLHGFYYHFVIYKGMTTTVRIHGTVQFSFFLATILNSTIVSSCDLLIVILIP